MTGQKRHAISVLVQWLLEENWSQEQLNAFLRYLNAWQWSEETEKIARAADGLFKEIFHRDMAQYLEPEERPWERILPPASRGPVVRAVQGIDEGRVF